jgi:hypothetical protein
MVIVVTTRLAFKTCFPELRKWQTEMRIPLSVLIVGTVLVLPHAGHGQVIGAYDNFDCFNDTGETAEGFEIDVEDVKPTDLTREFPSNFSTTPWVSRYGVPKVTSLLSLALLNSEWVMWHAG